MISPRLGGYGSSRFARSGVTSCPLRSKDPVLFPTSKPYFPFGGGERDPTDNRLTLEHTAKICKQAYPPGKHFTVPPIPDVASVNARGDYAIEADRLAFIDGDRDPWRVMVR